jgi:hypothetical protein
MREQVNQWLSSRPCLTCEDWFHRHWASPSLGMPKALVEFIYDRLSTYSGLTVGCINPTDRLLEDLHFPAVCWFDWGLTLCDDFYHAFGIDILDDFDETQFTTCADLMTFLQTHLPPHPS